MTGNESIQEYAADMDEYFDHIERMARNIEGRENRLGHRMNKLNRSFEKVIADVKRMKRYFLANRMTLTT